MHWLGAREGPSVSPAMVGESDGSVVGTRVGASERGDPVGAAVGLFDGAKLGPEVAGDKVGVRVGTDDTGSRVGTVEMGLGVGADEMGLGVGATKLVIAPVGTKVGTTVGAGGGLDPKDTTVTSTRIIAMTSEKKSNKARNIRLVCVLPASTPFLSPARPRAAFRAAGLERRSGQSRARPTGSSTPPSRSGRCRPRRRTSCSLAPALRVSGSRG